MMLNDEVVIVSGVGAGLGAKLAARAAAEGAKVVMAARSTRSWTRWRRRSRRQAARRSRCRATCRTEDVERVVATAVERFGTITGLVNWAYWHPGFNDLLATPDKALRRSMDIILLRRAGDDPRGGAAHDRRRLDRQRRHDVHPQADAW